MRSGYLGSLPQSKRSLLFQPLMWGSRSPWLQKGTQDEKGPWVTRCSASSCILWLGS